MAREEDVLTLEDRLSIHERANREPEPTVPTEREWFELFTMINDNLASIANASDSIAFPECSAGPIPAIEDLG